MDIAKLLAGPANYDAHDVTIADLHEENDRLRRLLAATARSYNEIKKDLDSCKEQLGHNRSPLRFLELPCELRDKIYSYALGAPHITTEPRPTAWLAFDYPQIKPATPNICLANKQLHQETREFLYSKNHFLFERPGHLFRFEQRVGSANFDLVRRIIIKTTEHWPGRSLMDDPEFVTPCDYLAIASHWAKGLNESKLKHVIEMTVINYPPMNRDTQAEIGPGSLKAAIEGLFARSNEPALVPRLTLKGFKKDEWMKFPRHWEMITVKSFPNYAATWAIGPSTDSWSGSASDHEDLG